MRRRMGACAESRMCERVSECGHCKVCVQVWVDVHSWEQYICMYVCMSVCMYTYIPSQLIHRTYVWVYVLYIDVTS